VPRRGKSSLGSRFREAFSTVVFRASFSAVMPAQAGIQYAAADREGTAYWIPALALLRIAGPE